METEYYRTSTLFYAWGIPVTWTPRAWQFFLPKFVIGIVVAWLILPEQTILVRLLWGIIYGLLLLSVLFLHIVGHIVSSRRVAPAMTELRIEQRLVETRYDADPLILPPRVHLIRSIGGPAINLIIGLLALMFARVAPHHAVYFFAGTNLAIYGLTLLPFPSVDGSVIWRELRRL